MKIDNQETLKQAIANNRLENLYPSPEISLMLSMALEGKDVDTEEIKSLLHQAHNINKKN